MRDQTDFATRITGINKTARKNGVGKRRMKKRLGERLVTPILLSLCMTGGVVMAWEMHDRPTDTPFEYAGTLTSIFLDYINTI